MNFNPQNAILSHLIPRELSYELGGCEQTKRKMSSRSIKIIQ